MEHEKGDNLSQNTKKKLIGNLLNNKIILLHYFILIALSGIIAILLGHPDGILTEEDSITIYLQSRVLLSHNWIPYFKWFHTPGYNYFIAIIVLLFGDNPYAIRVVQLLLYILTVIVVYEATRIKYSPKTALIAGIFYATSYVSTMASYIIHQEALVQLSVALFYYSAMRFDFEYTEYKENLLKQNKKFFTKKVWIWFIEEKEHKIPLKVNIWLYLSAIFLGVSFMIKEQSLVVLIFVAFYLIFIVIPEFKALIKAIILFGVFLGVFLVVEYIQGWTILKLYLSFGEGSDSFLSREGRIEYEKIINLFLSGPIPFLLAFYYIIIKSVEFVKNRKIDYELIYGIISIFYLVIFVIARSKYFHFVYALYPFVYLGSAGLERILKKFGKNGSLSNQFKKLAKIGMDEKVILLLMIIIQIGLFIPNLIVLREYGTERTDVFKEIADYVGDNVVYSQEHDALGYYIHNYYSDFSWYNSYSKHDFQYWDPDDVFVLTDMSNITKYNITYIIYRSHTWNSAFLEEIRTNGTLVFIRNFTYEERYFFWEEPTAYTYQLYRVVDR